MAFMEGCEKKMKNINKQLESMNAFFNIRADFYDDHMETPNMIFPKRMKKG
ncbi:MAG: hypothetical protein ACOC1O_05075 [bacterium]